MMLAIDWAHTKDFAVYDGKITELVLARRLLAK